MPLPAPPTTAVLLSDLARAVVAEAAPRELDLFDDVTAAWRRGELPATLRPGVLGHGGTIGLGLTSPVLVDLIYPLLTGTIAQIAGAATVRALTRRSWPWRRRPEVAVPLPVFTQAERVRVLCREQLIAAGLSVRRAEAIATAVSVALLRDALPPADEPPPTG